MDECTPALWYQQHYGHRLVLVHLDHLTGIGFIDEPIHQVVQVLCYGYFALIVGWLLTGNSQRSAAS